MPKVLHRLSARKAATLTTPGRHADGGNLYLSISRNGGKRWTLLYVYRGRSREMGLGSARAGGVPLAEAREQASAARKLLRQGVDPLEARRSAKRNVPTFGDFAQQYLDDILPGFSSEVHKAQWRMTIKEYAAPLHPYRVDEVSTGLVLDVVKPLWSARPETASRLRGRIEKILSSATAKGLRSGDNPARWRGHLDQMLAKL